MRTPEQQAIRDFLNGLTERQGKRVRVSDVTQATFGRDYLDEVWPVIQPLIPRLSSPMPQGFRISGYAYNLDPATGLYIDHPAYDIVPAEGMVDDCRPMKGGIVTWAWADERPELMEHPDWDRGLHVMVDHGNREISRYCHSRRLFVFAGQEVTTETSLGLMGDTGAARGPHWHIGFTRNGQPVDWIVEGGLVPLP